MNKYTIRRARKEDIEDICLVWQLSFGDSPETVKRLLEGCGLLESSIVAELASHVVGCTCLFHGLRGGDYPLSYLYALCTHPEYRGMGIARDILSASAEASLANGSALLCLRPGDKDLSRWYGSLGFKNLCTYSSIPLKIPSENDPSVTLNAVDISFEEYFAAREKADFFVSRQLLSAQEILNREYGGAFLRLGEEIFMCVEYSPSRLLVREYIGPKSNFSSAIQAVYKRFPAKNVLINTPSADGEQSLMYVGIGGSPIADPADHFLPFPLD